jgi:uncharacterized protein (DUF362 family)
MNRRKFLADLAGASSFVIASPLLAACHSTGVKKKLTPVAFVKTSDRMTGVARAINLLKLGSFRNRDVFIKPNYNSADATPGSTHNDTLVSLIQKLRGMGAGPLTIGDRSGMGVTREVMEAKEIFKLAKDMNLKTVVFDELEAQDWELIKPQAGAHWQKGFAIPKIVRSSGAIIQTCCLKTHRYGGHFTLSLKNSVGLAAKFFPGDSYNFMRELHSSEHQRRMIAEINAAYKPDLVVMDGVEAFTTGGPHEGKRVAANVVLASTDRVAIDAVGVAILRHFGTTEEVSRGAIFKQEQIARAVELNLGVSSPSEIELVTDDNDSAAYAKQIRAVLDGKQP